MAYASLPRTGSLLAKVLGPWIWFKQDRPVYREDYLMVKTLEDK
jgi:hypothetical protein